MSFKKILNSKNSRLDFQIQDGDEILIGSHPNIVTVEGEINRGGLIKYIPGSRLRDYLNISGGFTPDADKENIWIEYPNGESKKYKKFSLFSPKVLDGSKITVGKKKEEEPLDKTEFAKELTSIISNFAQALAIVMLARN